MVQELVVGKRGSGKTTYVKELATENNLNLVRFTDEDVDSFNELRSSVTESLSDKDPFYVFEDYDLYNKSQRKAVKRFIQNTVHDVAITTSNQGTVPKSLKAKLSLTNVEKGPGEIKKILKEEANKRNIETDTKEIGEIAFEAEGNIRWAIAKLENPNIEYNNQEELGLFNKLNLITSNRVVSEIIDDLKDINQVAFMNWVEESVVGGQKVGHPQHKQFFFQSLINNDKLLFETDAEFIYASMVYSVRHLNVGHIDWNYPSTPEDNHQKNQIAKKLSEEYGWSKREALQNYSVFHMMMKEDDQFRKEMIDRLDLSKSDCKYMEINYKEQDKSNNSKVETKSNEDSPKSLMEF